MRCYIASGPVALNYLFLMGLGLDAMPLANRSSPDISKKLSPLAFTVSFMPVACL
jgi:hypothetical protein